jgi:hypothetical protein
VLFFPRDVLCLIANYFLKEENYRNKRVFPFSYDWRNFMNTNKRCFGEWKKESQRIVLSSFHAENFVKSSAFRERILQLIMNPRLQLDLTFECEVYYGRKQLKIELKELNFIRKLYIQETVECYKMIPDVIDIEELALYNSPVDDLSYWSHVKSLTILPNYFTSRNVFDVSSLQNLEKGVFKISHCTNYQLLSNLKWLEISRCESITDVNCFQNIPHLGLHYCPGITDVSSLGNVRELNLSYCSNITDVSCLGKVHTLDLSHCPVWDLSRLIEVHSLKFEEFQGTDLSGLQRIVILNIAYSPAVTVIPPLRFLEELDIRECRQISSLSGLNKLKALVFSDQSQISFGREELFSQLRQLEFYNTGAAGEGQGLQGIPEDVVPWLQRNLHSLVIDESARLTGFTFPFLANLRSLKITLYSSQLSLSIPAIPSLGYLTISNCSVETVHICGGSDSSVLKYPLYEMIIKECMNVTEIQVDRKVFKCKISQCYVLTTVELNQQMSYLKWDWTTPLERIRNQSWLVHKERSSYLSFDEAIMVVNDELITS